MILDRILRRLVKRGELRITDAGGRMWRYGAPKPGLAPVALRFRDAKVPSDIARRPRLAAGEAYMDGRLTFDEGDFLGLMAIIGANGRFEDGGRSGPFFPRLKRLRAFLAARNEEARARRNVAHHYDIGNSLYRLFLDDDLQYSCAYFTEPSNGLERAQADKKAHVAAKLRLAPGQRVLDIGCGWGGLALYLNREYGVDVLGVTLSEEQLALARERAAAAGVADKVRFELRDYRRVEGEFDRIVSVGMFEHVGARHYREFFRHCRRLLAREGVMLLHTIGRFSEPSAGDPFADKYIFPGYHLPNLSQILKAGEPARLLAADVETLRLHYAYTLRHWLRNCETNREAIVALHDERFYRMWEVYLAGAIAMFESGEGCVYQLQYVRDRRALPLTRDYMLEEERRLREG